MNEHVQVILKVLLAGITGTFIMTFFVNAFSKISGDDFNVPAILSKLFRLKNAVYQLWLGRLTHYAIGIGFSTVLVYLWESDLSKPTFINVLVSGLIMGCIAVTVWRSMMFLAGFVLVHKKTLFLSLIFTGHIVFAFTAWFVWAYFPYGLS